jgi:hypothetical protein
MVQGHEEKFFTMKVMKTSASARSRHDTVGDERRWPRSGHAATSRAHESARRANESARQTAVVRFHSRVMPIHAAALIAAVRSPSCPSWLSPSCSSWSIPGG